jgi:hypothetical protein
MLEGVTRVKDDLWGPRRACAAQSAAAVARADMPVAPGQDGSTMSPVFAANSYKEGME